jgi:dTDP-4-amino-4,6-dideoxygalactose transaminase
LFHTVEGGAVFTKNADLLKKMSFLRNFGHDGYEKFSDIGINGKNSEFHAAMGLVNLKYIDEILINRRKLSMYYNDALVNLKCIKPTLIHDSQYNYSYYPVVLESEEITLKMIQVLNDNWIYPRRYFYPNLSKMSYIEDNFVLPITESISKRVLCLPLFHSLSKEEIDLIARIMLRVQNN